METFYFHDFFYFLDKIWTSKLIIQHKDDDWFNERDDSIVEQVLNYKRAVCKPTPGEPFKFFNWFFKDGFDLFADYINEAGHRGIDEETFYTNELKNLMALCEAQSKSLIKKEISNCFDSSKVITPLQNLPKILDSINLENLSKAKKHFKTLNKALADKKKSLKEFVKSIVEELNYSEIEIHFNVLNNDQKRELVGDLHKMELNHEHVFDSRTTQDDLFNFLYEKDIHKKPKEIFMTCGKNEAAVILQQLKVLGFKIVYENFEKFKSVLVKNKPLTAHYISKSLVEAGKGTSPKRLHHIQFFFSDLKYRYFLQHSKKS